MKLDYPLAEMAHYNQWQNQNLINAANQLTSEQRQRDLGAFFHSIEKTFSHILWGDKIWLSRFGDFHPPDAKNLKDSLHEGGPWEDFIAERAALDIKIINWTTDLKIEDLPKSLTWFSKAVDREVTQPISILLPHLFNHQTHHRGQIHAMLTRLGKVPAATDLPFMPPID